MPDMLKKIDATIRRRRRRHPASVLALLLAAAAVAASPSSPITSALVLSPPPAFATRRPSRFLRPPPVVVGTDDDGASSSSSALRMCICINCKRVTNCAAYHFVETKHSQPHMTDEPTFTPRDGSPTIHVNVRTTRNDDDRKKEIERMWREHESETAKAEAASAAEGGEKEEKKLYGETKYDLSPVTTYEYDVVKCDDFVEDVGCWVRNMPEEIRIANPDFVPS